MSIRSNPKLYNVLGAAAVHVFTATGAVLGLLALLAAAEGRWADAFVWLGVALIVDGADGPLARRLEVKRVLSRFSGEDLDKIIDYVTYVTVPAFIVARASIVPEGLRLILAATMMMVSLYHFSDKNSKTAAGYFVGFPAVWNAIVLYCFVLGMDPALSAALIGLCAILTFVPFRYVHPLRVKRLRALTLLIVFAWGAAAVSAVSHGFPGTLAERVIFVLTAAYIVAFGLSAASERDSIQHRYPTE
ncbi:MAG: CDP-alcohol phosphatidyltransferase family protein [Rhodomicrobium sp.]